MPPPPPPAPALERLLAEEAFVRSLARSLVAGDAAAAEDVVQQTWLQAIDHGPERVTAPRSWLARIVRNVAANLRRGERRRRARENAVAVRDRVPSSAELVAREEQRRAIVAAVDRLPPPLRTVVWLRWFEGLPPRRIGAELGLTAADVSVQLRRALERLRRDLDAGHGGDRRAWLLPLAAFAVAPKVPAAPALPAAALLAGAITTMAKTKLGLAAAAMVLALGALVAWRLAGDADTPVPGPPAEAPPHLQTALDRHAPDAATSAASSTSERQPASAALPGEVAAPGRLVVRAHWRDSERSAAGVIVIVSRAGAQRHLSRRSMRTDPSGEAVFEAMPPGAFHVCSHLGEPLLQTQVFANRTTTTTLAVPPGQALSGVVVDRDGVPVSGALVEVVPPGLIDVDPEVLAVSGPGGLFHVPAAPASCLLGARADGHRASPLRQVLGADGGTREGVRLQLGGPAGAVHGVVVAPDGTGVADAVVVVGEGKLSGTVAGSDGGPPLPAFARTDEHGRFTAIGVPPGEQPVRARAAAFAPWRGTCTVAAHAAAPLRIELTAGAVLRGRVRSPTGNPVAGAVVAIGDWQDLDHFSTQSATDGSFELAGLPAREVQVLAARSDLGKVTRTVPLQANADNVCELRLEPGLELRGRVLDEHGEPVANAQVTCHGGRIETGARFYGAGVTDVDGAFRVVACPPGQRLVVAVVGRGIEPLQRQDVDPRDGELQLRVRRAPPADAEVVGVVADADGKPLANAHVHARREGAPRVAARARTGDDGRFTLGPLVPGPYLLQVVAADQPRTIVEHDVPKGARLDAGVIRLPRGGTLALTLRDVVDPAAVHLALCRDARVMRRLHPQGAFLRVPGLPAAEWSLEVSGAGIAAAMVPFTIRPGEETALTVEPRAGTRQRLQVVPAPEDPAASEAQLVVRRDGGVVQQLRVPFATAGSPAAADLWLAPGRYEVRAEAGARHAQAAFTVGDVEGTLLRLALQ